MKQDRYQAVTGKASGLLGLVFGVYIFFLTGPIGGIGTPRAEYGTAIREPTPGGLDPASMPDQPLFFLAFHRWIRRRAAAPVFPVSSRHAVMLAYPPENAAKSMGNWLYYICLDTA